MRNTIASRLLHTASFVITIVMVGMLLAPAAAEPQKTVVAMTNFWEGVIKQAPVAQRATPIARAIAMRYKIDETDAIRFVAIASRAAEKTEVPVELILAVIARESSFKPKAFNNGDSGLMQVNPRWHPEKVAAVGGKKELFKPEVNVEVGAMILAEYIKMSKGDLWWGLRRYNGVGKNNNYPDLVLAEMRQLKRHL